MFLAGEPARIRQDAVTPPRNTESYPPSTPPETPPNPPSLSSMAAMSAFEIQYRFRDAPSPPPNRPLPPLPPPKVRSASPSTPPFPGAQVTKERLGAKRPKRSPTPPRRHTTPTPKTTTTWIESFEEEIEPRLTFSPDKDIEKFVNSIAENQLESPIRPSYPRQRLSSNSLKRISAPAVPYDPVTEKTPPKIAKRNRSTNIFQVFDQLDSEKAGLDDIHEEHGENVVGDKEVLKKKSDRRESRHSGGVWNGAPVSPLSQRSSMKSVQDLVWPEERQGNGSPVSRSSQRNSMKSVQNMVWPEDKANRASPTSRPSQRNSMKSVQGLFRPEEKQENRSSALPLSQRSSMKSVQDLVWPEDKQGSRSPSSRSSRRSSTKSVQDLVWPGEPRPNPEKLRGFVRRSTGKVIDRDLMFSQEGSIFTGSPHSPLSHRNSVKTIEDLFRGERDVEFRRQLEDAGFVLDPEIEEQALDVMVSSATDHIQGVHSPDSEEYISEGHQLSNTEAFVLPRTNKTPSEQTVTLVTDKAEEYNTTANIEYFEFAGTAADLQLEDIESPNKQDDILPTGEPEKEHSTTTDIEPMDCTAAQIGTQQKDINEPEGLDEQAQPRPSIHMGEREGGLADPAQDTVILPPTIEQRDFAFVDKSIRRKPVGSGTSRPSSPADTSMSNGPLEGTEKPGIYNPDDLPVMMSTLNTEDDKRPLLQKRGISFQEPTSNPPSRTPSKSYQRPLVNAINDDVKKQDPKPPTTIKHPYPSTLHPSPRSQEKKKSSCAPFQNLMHKFDEKCPVSTSKPFFPKHRKSEGKAKVGPSSVSFERGMKGISKHFSFFKNKLQIHKTKFLHHKTVFVQRYRKKKVV